MKVLSSNSINVNTQAPEPIGVYRELVIFEGVSKGGRGALVERLGRVKTYVIACSNLICYDLFTSRPDFQLQTLISKTIAAITLYR